METTEDRGEQLREYIHSLIPDGRREPGIKGKRWSPAMLERAAALEAYLRANCVGTENAKPGPYIARRLGLYSTKDRKDRGVSLRALGLILTQRGVPYCAVSTGPAKRRGVFLAKTAEERERYADYLLTMALGLVNSALAVRLCAPVGGSPGPAQPGLFAVGKKFEDPA